MDKLFSILAQVPEYIQDREPFKMSKVSRVFRFLAEIPHEITALQDNTDIFRKLAKTVQILIHFFCFWKPRALCMRTDNPPDCRQRKFPENFH